MTRATNLQVMVLVVGLVLIIAGTADRTLAQMTPSEADEKVGVEGEFVRVATNDHGWVTLGYRIANESVGKKWMLLEIGLTVPHGSKPTVIKRDDVYLVSPDNQRVLLATQAEYQKAQLEGLDAEANMVRDSIDYFPSGINTQTRLGFFADMVHGARGMKYDEAELNDQTATMGRVYFNLPDGIQYGTYNLDIDFNDSTVRVPFKIMTKDEAKAFKKQWKQSRKKKKGQ